MEATNLWIDKLCVFPEDEALKKYAGKKMKLEDGSSVSMEVLCEKSKYHQRQALLQCISRLKRRLSKEGVEQTIAFQLAETLLLLEIACGVHKIHFNLEKAYKLSPIDEKPYDILRAKMHFLLEDQVSRFDPSELVRNLGLLPIQKTLLLLSKQMRDQLSSNGTHVKYFPRYTGALFSIIAKKKKMRIDLKLLQRLTFSTTEQFDAALKEIKSEIFPHLLARQNKENIKAHDLETLEDTPGLDSIAAKAKAEETRKKEYEQWKAKVLSKK